MNESMIKLVQEARNYLVGEMIADEVCGRRSSLDKERADLVIRMESFLQQWRHETTEYI